MHFPAIFQATSPAERACEILHAGGIVLVKAHTAKRVPGHTHVDGVDRRFGDIKDRYGDAVAWTIMGETAAGLRGMAAGFPAPRSTPAAARPPMAKPAMMVPKDAARASAT